MVKSEVKTETEFNVPMIQQRGVMYREKPVSRILTFNPQTNTMELVDSPSLSQENASQAIKRAALLPYEYDPEDEDDLKHPEFQHMTMLEVMNFRQVRDAAKGDEKATIQVQNRLAGTPMQCSEVKTFSATYQDFIDALASREEAEPTKFHKSTLVEPTAPIKPTEASMDFSEDILS